MSLLILRLTAVIALCLPVLASSAESEDPRTLTLDDLGITRRIGPDRVPVTPYFVPAWIYVYNVSISFDGKSRFSAETQDESGAAVVLFHAQDDPSHPVQLGRWQPDKPVLEVPDTLSPDKGIWQYWKVDWDEKLVSLQKIRPDDYFFRAHGPAPAGGTAGRQAEGKEGDKKAGSDFCKDNPRLEGASFVVIFKPDHGGPALKWSFSFDHCSLIGSSNGPAMRVQRAYKSEDGQGLFIHTDISAAVSSVSLMTIKDGGRHWDCDLGLLDNGDLVSGKELKVEPVRIQSASNGMMRELTGSIAIIGVRQGLRPIGSRKLGPRAKGVK